MPADTIAEASGAGQGLAGLQGSEAMTEFVGDGVGFIHAPLLVCTLPIAAQAMLWEGGQLQCQMLGGFDSFAGGNDPIG